MTRMNTWPGLRDALLYGVTIPRAHVRLGCGSLAVSDNAKYEEVIHQPSGVTHGRPQPATD